MKIKIKVDIFYTYINLYFNYLIAFSINLSSNSEYETPTTSNNFGYILILVNPGIVFISLIYILFVSFSTKKSTLDNPFPSIALNALIANFRISSICSSVISAGIIVFDSGILYLASKL